MTQEQCLIKNKTIIEDYEGMIIKVEFLVSHNLRWSHKGKHWPKTTQCVIYCNNRIIGLGESVKHYLDNDNDKYAMTYAAKKAFTRARLWKEMRARIWSKILNYPVFDSFGTIID